MLVFGRKNNERLVINGNIEVIVLETRYDKVCIGVKAPDGTTVQRREIPVVRRTTRYDEGVTGQNGKLARKTPSQPNPYLMFWRKMAAYRTRNPML